MDSLYPSSDDLSAAGAASHRPSVQRLPSDKVQELEDGMERLLLITEALWNLLKEQHGYEDQELIRRIAAIDMKDGKYDHRVAKTAPKPCPKCTRTLGKHRTKCLYCGEPILMSPFER